MTALRDLGVPFEIIGGVAVNAHIYASDPSRSFVTRDIDLLVRRDDLSRIAEAAEPLGYMPKRMAGGYTWIRPGQDPGEAVHLRFAGERSRPREPLPYPELDPEEKRLLSLDVPVAPLKDLLQMTVSSLRLKDRAYIQILDEAGMITPALEDQLPPFLRHRLAEARMFMAQSEPDVEG